MPDLPVACPWCRLGRLSVSRGATLTTWHTGYHVPGGAGLEARLRPCTAAACNRCEFIAEVTPRGIVPADLIDTLQ